MLTEIVNCEALMYDPANARKHSKKNLDAIKGSLKKFGQQKPIVISADNVVIAGNGTLEAAKALGWEEISVVRSHLTGAEAIAFAIADNRTAELAEWDDDILAQTLKSLSDDDFDLASIGFHEKDLAKMFKDIVDASPQGEKFKTIFEVVVTCECEEDQEKMFTEITDRGYKCRVLSM